MATSLSTRDGTQQQQPKSSRYSDSAGMLQQTASGVGVQTPSRHIPIVVWLSTIGLPEYVEYFAAYEGVEEVLFMKELDVKNMGVKNTGHRARIVSSLALLRDKYDQLTTGNGHASNRMRTTQSAGNLASLAPPASSLAPGGRSEQWLAAPSAAPQADAAALAAARRLLEAELRLDPRDLRSHAWFHGAVPRQQAEAMVFADGNFLVRESTSQPGDYVLTCCWGNTPLHFVINKHVAASGAYSRVQYAFESTAYDSVQALIMSCVAERKRVTQASGAVISMPINRTVPIALLDRYKELQVTASQLPLAGVSEEYTVPSVNAPVRGTREGEVPVQGQRLTQVPSPASTGTGTRTTRRVDSLPHLHATANMPYVNGSQAADSVSGAAIERSGSMPSVERSGSAPVNGQAFGHAAPLRGAGSEPTLLEEDSGLGDERASSDSDLARPPPPKPGRLPTIKRKDRPAVEIRNKALYDDDGKDYSDYEQVKRQPGTMKQNESKADKANSAPKAVYDKNSNHIYSRAQDAENGGVDDLIYDLPKAGGSAATSLFREPIVPPRYVDADSFNSVLLPDGNKPLEPSAMYQIKEALLRKDYRLLAQHITYLDLHLLKVVNSKNLGAGVYSGLEAMTLPQGKHFRQAVIERHYSLSYLVAVTVLACTDDAQERALMLKQWILIAAELLRSLGNLFSFCAIAEGLLHSSVSRLRGTWGILRRAEPQMAHVFDTKLRSTYISLNASSNGLPLGDDVCVPHILPLAELLEAGEGEVLPAPPSWRSGSELDVVLAHLDTARFVAGQTAAYHRKGDAAIVYFAPNSLLRDMFKVEFHMKLLFGHRGALANRCERYQKFQQILAILSRRAEPDNDGTEL